MPKQCPPEEKTKKIQKTSQNTNKLTRTRDNTSFAVLLLGFQKLDLDYKGVCLAMLDFFPCKVLKNGVEVKLQRNALSVLEHPTGNENDDHDFDNSSCSSDIGEKDNDFCKSHFS